MLVRGDFKMVSSYIISLYVCACGVCVCVLHQWNRLYCVPKENHLDLHFGTFIKVQTEFV